jgi:hypothetical protein
MLLGVMGSRELDVASTVVCVYGQSLLPLNVPGGLGSDSMYSIESSLVSELRSLDSLASTTSSIQFSSDRIGPTPLITALLHDRSEMVLPSECHCVMSFDEWPRHGIVCRVPLCRWPCYWISEPVRA